MYVYLQRSASTSRELHCFSFRFAVSSILWRCRWFCTSVYTKTHAYRFFQRNLANTNTSRCSKVYLAFSQQPGGGKVSARSNLSVPSDDDWECCKTIWKRVRCKLDLVYPDKNTSNLSDDLPRKIHSLLWVLCRKDKKVVQILYTFLSLISSVPHYHCDITPKSLYRYIDISGAHSQQATVNLLHTQPNEISTLKA